MISGFITQGALTAPNWVKSYEISTSLDGKTFTPYTDTPNETTPKLFTANTDQSQVVTSLFSRNVPARYVRLIVKDYNGKVALRLNTLGCSPGTTQTPASLGTVTPTRGPTSSSVTVTPAPTTPVTSAPGESGQPSV